MPVNRSTRGRTVAAGLPVRLLAGLLVTVTVATIGSGRTVDAAPCWYPPVVGVVTDPYREPPCAWCAGNRGLDYRVGDDAVVRAAASGRVEFVGTVVDIGYVVIRLPSGWRHTYGRLTSTTARLGDVVLAGAPVGRASGTFFFGLRIGDDYADPSPYIGVMRTRPRLVPVDATLPRPAPLARPRCSGPPIRPSDERGDAIRAVGSSVTGVGGLR